MSIDAGHWLVDSACTAHMTSELGDLSSVQNIRRTKVECGGGTILEASQVGSVSIPTRDSSGNDIVVVLQDVLFVPKLGKRLQKVHSL